MKPVPLVSHDRAGEVFRSWFATNRDSRLRRFYWCPRSPGNDYVYFAILGDTIKVGWSKNPRSRMRHLGGEGWRLLVLLRDSYFSDEQILVESLAHFRKRGREWLAASRPLLTLIGQLREAAEACLYVAPRKSGRLRKLARRYVCSRCGTAGHNKATCENQLSTEAA